ncbi:MAG TPA: hypothetical protein VGL42_06805 [Opitutaceae bacterium]|jgi:hypothetical protein
MYLLDKLVNSPSKTVKKLKLNERQTSEEICRVDYDLRNSRRRLEETVARGVTAEKKGDTAASAEAAMEFEAHKAECKALQHDRQNLMKTRMLSHITVRKLERFGGKKQKDVFKVIEKVFDDETVKGMVDDANIRAEEFSSRLDRLLDVEIQRLDDQTSANRMETTEAQQLFRQLADATEKGDVERVKSINKQLTGEDNVALAGMESVAGA